MSGTDGSGPGARIQAWAALLTALAGLIVVLGLSGALRGIVPSGASESSGAGGTVTVEPATPTTPTTPTTTTVTAGASPPTHSEARRAPIEGQVLEPQAETVQPPTFRARFQLVGDLRGEHVWLAIKIGPDQYFMQGDELGRTDQSVLVHVGDDLGRFSVVLVAVDGRDNDAVTQWVASRRLTGAGPAIGGLRSLRTLDEVGGLLARS